MTLNVFQKHQLKIAKSTLRMHDAGALIMGGMTKDEARQFLASIGWTAEQIAAIEPSVQGDDEPSHDDSVTHGENCGCKSFDDCPAR